MSDTLSVAAWLDHLDREYLSSFIQEGGAAVKFAVASPRSSQELQLALRTRAENSDYLFIHLDAATCRVHLPQQIFFSLAKQLDWRMLARRRFLRLFEEDEFQTDGIDPRNELDIVAAVARVNELDRTFVRSRSRRLLQDHVFKDPNMVHAFRIAMSWLCQYEGQEDDSVEYGGQPLVEWLTGENTRISSVRSFDVYTPINRTTARHFLESTLYWIRQSGYQGTVIYLDDARLAFARNPRDGLPYYTRAMTVDHYEVLREFIDDIDDLSATLLIVAPDESFTDEQSNRGWGLYDALRTRVMNDVYDKNVINPVAALVRLT